MLRITTIIILTLIIFFITSNVGQAQISEHIHVDQFGYTLDADKVAVISNPQTGFNSDLSYTPGNTLELRNLLNDQVVFSGSADAWDNGNTHTQSGDQGWWFDFSTVNTEGTYYVYDPTNDASSPPFQINDNPYIDVAKAATKMFYYNRCNEDKDGNHVETGFEDGMNFMNDLQDANCRYVYDQSNESLEKDLSGGWWDAGDNNKYVTFAHSVIHDMVGMYENSPEVFTDDFNIPESGDGIPDLLNELKWELDWLMKMSNANGTAHIKMGNIDYSHNVLTPPSLNNDPRYYGPECTAASIAIASMFARSAIVYQDIVGLEDFAEDLEDRAIACWDHFEAAFNNDNLDYSCDDGTIKSGDADWNYENQRDAAVVAALYLFELSADDAYEDFFLTHYADTEPVGGYWGPYKMTLNEALLRYTTLPGISTSDADVIFDSAADALNNNWEGFYLPNDSDLYRAFTPDYMFNWGSSLTQSNLGNLCLLLKQYDVVSSLNDDLEAKAAAQLHYMHGVNPLGMVMLSNMYNYGGDRCVDEVYHFWFNDGSEWDNVINDDFGPAPGFVTGGPNHAYSGSLTPPANQPVQKSYAQFNSVPESSWEITEPAIYYQAGFLKLVSYFSNDTEISSNTNIQVANNCIEIFPNPTDDYFIVNGLFDDYQIKVLDANGATYLTLNPIGSETIIDVSTLPSGMFFISVENQDHEDVCVQKIIKEE